MKVFHDSLSKKNELATYKRLGLSREGKSKRQRQKAEAEKLHRYIGQGTASRPYLKVLRSDYLRVWDEVNTELAQKNAPSGLTPAEWADWRRVRVEREVYDRLARQHRAMVELESSFQKRHGRGLTPHERSLFGRMMEKDEGSASSPQKRARALRKSVAAEVLGKVESKRRHQPARLQQAWATVVGEEAAQETFLEKIDTQNGIAVCRCLSSTLAFKLRRRRNLAAKLGKELGMSLKRIVFR